MRRGINVSSGSQKLAVITALAASFVFGGCGSTHQPAAAGSTASSDGGSSTTTTSAVSAAVLSVSNQTLSFGNVTVGSSTSQLISLTNTGSASLKLASVSVSGQGYSVTGNTSVTLTPSQSVTIYVNFGPSTSGYAGGTLAIASNASNPVVQVGVSGTGVTAQTSGHSVSLAWTPATSNVVGYYIYRSTVSGGPYTKLNASADTQSSFTDPDLTAGTYYYVVTSVDSDNVESGYSNQVQVTVP